LFNFSGTSASRTEGIYQGQLGIDDGYFDETADDILINKIADECYLPANDRVWNVSCLCNTAFKFAAVINFRFELSLN
jgi:hypothetical protein